LQPDPAPDIELTLREVSPGAVGRYVLVRPLGKGASGEVWRAEDPEIGREVAVKIMRVPDGLSDDDREEWRQRFLQEARAAGRLSHPGIVPVYDVGRADDGRPFIVMELIEGRSLETVIGQGPRPSAGTVLGWGAQVAEALDAAHAHGIIHRDIKPANILIDAAGRARIADFGIARLSDSELTRTGLFLGSPAYAAPEQLRGEPVDARTDLFSLGASLYVALTGRKPFRGDDLASLAYAICHSDPSPPCGHEPALPPSCDTILLRALAKEPARRYQSGCGMAADLKAALAAPTSPSLAATTETPDLATILRILGQKLREGAARACAGAGRLWMKGWRQGPRARAAMIAGVVILIALIGIGSIAIADRIEARRQSPGRKLKKAFRSLVSEIQPPPGHPRSS